MATRKTVKRPNVANDVRKVLDELQKLRDENAWLSKQRDELLARDMESERNTALLAQNTVLGDKCKDYDRICADLRRLRLNLKELYPMDLANAEEVNTGLMDLTIWILRGKPGPQREGKEKIDENA